MDDLLPFIRNLCDRVSYTPNDSELQLLKKTTVREMSIFYDALSSGGSDKEIFDKMLYFQRLREQGKEKGFKVSEDIPAHEKKLSLGDNDVSAKAALRLAKDENKELEGGMTIHVTPAGTHCIIAVTTPSSSVSKERKSYEMKLDFNTSENCVLVPDGHRSAKLVGSKGAELNMLFADVELGANRVVIGKLIPKYKNQGNGDANRFASKIGKYEVFVNSTDEERAAAKKRMAEEAKAREAPPTGGSGGGGGGNVKNLAAMFGAAPAENDPIPPVKRAAPAPKPVETPLDTSHLSKASTATKTATPSAGSNLSAAVEVTKSATPIEKKEVSSIPAGTSDTTAPATPEQMLSVVVVDESEIDGPPEAKNLAENLELKVYTVNHGYRFIAINRDQKASFTITFDLSKCDNLTIQPNTPDATFGSKEGCPEGTVITILVPPKHEKLVANLPVADFDKGSCEMKYVASIRKTI